LEGWRNEARDYIVVASGSMLLVAVWSRAGFGGPLATRAFVDVATTLAAAMACALCLRRARQERTLSPATWYLLGMAAGCWALGNAVWTYYEVIARESTPFPSLADAGYVALIPLAAAALLVTISRSIGRASRFRTLLDGLLVCATLFFTCYALFLRPLLAYAHQQPNLLAKFLAIAYPIGDVGLLAMVILLLERVGKPARAPLLGLALAFAGLAIADIGFWYQTAVGTYATGAWTDLGWVGAFLVVGAVAQHRSSLIAHPPDARPGLGLAILPFFPFALACIASAWVQVREGALDATLYWTALIVFVVLSVRQFLLILENRRTQEQRAAALLLAGELERIEKVDQFRSDFINSISHELRTPITPLKLSLAMLRRKSPELEGGRILPVMQGSIDRLAELVENMVRAAELQAKDLVLSRVPIDLATMVRESANEYASRAKERGILLEVHAAVANPLGDGAKVRHAVDQLISNAIKFTEAGGRITVTLKASADHAWLEVRDTGVGMTKDQIGQLFQPFRRLHEDRLWSTHGAGLGLYTAKLIADIHGGQVRASSSGPGQGSSFTLILPVRGPEKPPAVPSANPGSGQAAHA
jgi:signal transduction histidine kinase